MLSGIAGVSIGLYRAGVQIATTSTNATGYYAFSSVLPGIVLTQLTSGLEVTHVRECARDA